MLGNLVQPQHPSGRARAQTASLDAPASMSACQYSGGRSFPGPGPPGGGAFLLTAAAIFSICLGVGMRQLAGRSFMLGISTYQEQESRVRLSKNHTDARPVRSEPWSADRLESTRRPVRSTALMAPRANWKGFLRLSLVTCPVALYPATSESEKISFNQLNR
jgi:hypothetical protein